MNITKVVFICIFCMVVIMVIRRFSSDYAMLASLSINISVTAFALLILEPVFVYVKQLASLSDSFELCEIMFKSAGICLLCSLASELCADAGEASLSSKIEFAGKCTLLTYCLPLIKKVFEYATTFIG